MGLEKDLEDSIDRKLFLQMNIKWTATLRDARDTVLNKANTAPTLEVQCRRWGWEQILTSKFLLQKEKRGCHLYQERLKMEEWARVSQAEGL